MRMCYSQTLNSWNSWEPTVANSPLPASSTSLPPSTSIESFKFALSRNHIGFRGVVCTSSLPISQLEGEQGDDTEDGEELEVDDSSVPRTLYPGTYFVMAGRLSQSVTSPSPKVSGLWLLDPWAPRPAIEARDPTYALQPDLDGLLHRATAVCGAVGLANWTALRASAGSSNGVQEVQAARQPTSSLSPLRPHIMRFSTSSTEQNVGDQSDISASAAALFAFHHHNRNNGAGSDSD